MSANLDLVRSIYAAWERGDFSRTDWTDPEMELVIADGPTPGTWTGVAGRAEGTRELLGAWDELRVLAQEYREIDHERVLVLLDNHGVGKTSGMDLHQMQGGANLLHVCDGKVTRFVVYWDRERALADLGLEGQAMLQENVELVRRAIQAFNDRDFPAMDSIYSEDVVFSLIGGFADLTGAQFRNRDAVLDWMRDWIEPWEEFRVEAEEQRELDDERVLALHRHSGRGKTSGVELERMRAKGASLFHVHDGTVTRFVTYLDRERALADLGLAPELG